jgi:acetyl esterase/lipase
MGRSRFFLTAAVTFACLVKAASVFANDLPPPDQKGPYNVGAKLFTATVSGGRVTRVQVFYPTLASSDSTSIYTINMPAGNYSIRSPLGAAHDAPPAPGPFPLVVHDHGGAPAGQDFHRVSQLPVHELMASHGIVTAIFLHGGNPLVRAQDFPLVIDVMLSGINPLSQSIDPARIGISGISAGGGSAISTAGGWANNGIAADPRVKAMVLYEPAVNSLEDASTIRIPYLIMGGLQNRNGLAVPALFETTAASTARIYVQTPRAGHFSYNTGMPDEVDQAREQALLAFPNIPEPLTTLTPTNAAAARAYEIWNWHQILYPQLGPGVGGGRNLCDRVGINSVRPLDVNFDGLTDSPPFMPIDPPYLVEPLIRAEEMIPMVKLYTVAFWKVRLAGDHRYQRYLAPGYAQSNNLEANVFVGE